MIEGMKQWVAELAVIALVFGFAEMILPRNDLRRLARVVIGLVVVALILSSLLDVSRVEETLAVTSLNAAERASGMDSPGYAAQGRKIAEAGMEVASADVKERVSRQIESLARLCSGAETASAEVIVGPSGTLEEVNVVIAGVAPGASGQDPSPSGARDGDAPVVATALVEKRVERVIRDFYGLGDDTRITAEARL